INFPHERSYTAPHQSCEGGIVAHGGKRPGAGRRLGSKNKRRKADVDRITGEVLRSVDSVALWKKILHSNSPKTILGALQYLMDRHFGRPSQTIQGGSQPVRIEFSWAAPALPEWLTPAPVKVESRVVPQLQQHLLEQVVTPMDDTERAESEE